MIVIFPFQFLPYSSPASSESYNRSPAPLSRTYGSVLSTPEEGTPGSESTRSHHLHAWRWTSGYGEEEVFIHTDTITILHKTGL